MIYSLFKIQQSVNTDAEVNESITMSSPTASREKQDFIGVENELEIVLDKNKLLEYTSSIFEGDSIFEFEKVLPTHFTLFLDIYANRTAQNNIQKTTI